MNIEWPENEERIDIIASNGNLGLHYTHTCEHWDCGWCYKKNTIYENGCVGLYNCAYIDKAYSKEYDAYYEVNTGFWIEPKGFDTTCEFCSNRPEKAF